MNYLSHFAALTTKQTYLRRAWT